MITNYVRQVSLDQFHTSEYLNDHNKISQYEMIWTLANINTPHFDIRHIELTLVFSTRLSDPFINLPFVWMLLTVFLA